MASDVLTNGGVSFWYSDIGGPPQYRSPLPGDRDTDICIVGGGFTGLWTAYYLKKADPSLDIIIVEKEFAGYGSSGRNGGHLLGGCRWNRSKYLETSSRSEVVEFEHALSATVDEVISRAELEGIDADIHRTEALIAARNGPQLERLKRYRKHCVNWGVDADDMFLIGGEELRARVNVAGALGASVTRGAARVQPAKLVQGLAAAVERLGVRIFEQTTVGEISKGAVRTDRGTVRARRIVRATEGYSAGLKGYRRAWIPLNSAIVVTEPLPEDMWKSIGWEGRELLNEISHVYAYAQRTRENRIAMGGRGVPYRFGSGIDHRGETQEATIAQLKEMLYRLFPQTREARLDHAWCGVLGTPRDWCATVGIDERSEIAWAGGYVGHGVTTSNLAGRTLTDLLLGRKSELTGLPWVNRKVKNWEIEPFRFLGVTTMYQLYRIADAREASGKSERTSRLAALANKLTGR